MYAPNALCILTRVNSSWKKVKLTNIPPNKGDKGENEWASEKKSGEPVKEDAHSKVWKRRHLSNWPLNLK